MFEYFNSLIQVGYEDAAQPPTDEEKEEMIKILEETEANGEIDLSQFCIPMGK